LRRGFRAGARYPQAQSWIEVDAGYVRAAGAVHQDERDQGHAQDDDDGGEEPPGYVLGEHQPLRVKPGVPELPHLSYLPSVTQVAWFHGRSHIGCRAEIGALDAGVDAPDAVVEEDDRRRHLVRHEVLELKVELLSFGLVQRADRLSRTESTWSFLKSKPLKPPGTVLRECHSCPWSGSSSKLKPTRNTSKVRMLTIWLTS